MERENLIIGAGALVAGMIIGTGVTNRARDKKELKVHRFRDKVVMESETRLDEIEERLDDIEDYLDE